jgi:hypothetical protein
MAIIAVLVGISVPAVLKAKEAANRSTCANNLRELGHAFMAHQTQVGYLPTAGYSDASAPVYYSNSTNNYFPVVGWKQEASWAFQILPYLGAENVWTGGGSAPTATAAMQNSLKTPVKNFFCPSRRVPGTTTYTAVGFPSGGMLLPNGTHTQDVYTAVAGSQFTVVPIDYAGCNGKGTVDSSNRPIQDGAVLSQAPGRTTITTDDIKDGPGYTLLLGEKAANPFKAPIAYEDDEGYASGFGGTNLNNIRWTKGTALPLKDAEVTGTTGGAFGSAHATAWNALFADGAVRPLPYNMDSTVYQAIGTIRGRELIGDADIGF